PRPAFSTMKSSALSPLSSELISPSASMRTASLVLTSLAKTDSATCSRSQPQSEANPSPTAPFDPPKSSFYPHRPPLFNFQGLFASLNPQHMYAPYTPKNSSASNESLTAFKGSIPEPPGPRSLGQCAGSNLIWHPISMNSPNRRILLMNSLTMDQTPPGSTI